jgi:hypothetical protein
MPGALHIGTFFETPCTLPYKGLNKIIKGRATGGKEERLLNVASYANTA